MIKHFEVLRGLPGQTELPVIHYGPVAKKTGREGVVLRLEDEAGACIGNFDSNRQPGRLSLYLTEKGVAIIFADQFCHVLKARDEDHILDGYGPWSLSIEAQLDKRSLLVCGSSHGRIATLDAQGREIGSAYFDCCEELKYSIAEGAVKGDYYEFNLQRRVPFRLSLPGLES